MQINKTTCGNCCGKGYVETYKIVENSACGLIRREQDICEQCGGNGYIEYPVFTVEEAVKIAKHFGFDIEVEE